MATAVTRQSVSDAASGLAVGLLVFAAYIATLYPTVAGGDAGELVGVACSTGVAHPPGYPLYSMLAGLFVRLPLGNPAWRVNLSSALYDAAAAGFLAATVSRWSRHLWAALLAAGLFAFAPLIWNYSTAAEVFALNNLFVALLLYQCVRAAPHPTPAQAKGIAFTIGLGLTHHHTFLFVAAPLGVWAVLAARFPRRARGILACALCAAAGLLPYAYLPLAGARDPLVSWGDWSSVHGFVDHLLRRDYGTLVLSQRDSRPDWFAALSAYADREWRETLYGGVLLAAAGAAWMVRDRSRRSLALCLLAAWLGYLVVFHALANLPVGDALFAEVTSRFWQQAHVVVCLWIGLGAAALARRFAAPVAAQAAIVLAAVAAQAGLHATTCNRSGMRLFPQYAHALLDPLPHGALLLTRGDLVTNTVRYLQVCEGIRPDVVTLDQEMLTKSWYVASARRRHPTVTFPAARYFPGMADGFSLRELLQANPSATVFVYPEIKDGDLSWRGSYELRPFGLVQRILPAAGPLDWEAANRDAWQQVDRVAWPPPDSEWRGSWERVVLEDYLGAHHRVGLAYLNDAIAAGDAPSTLQVARREFEFVAKRQSDAPWYVYKNLGITYQRLAAQEPALEADARAAWRRYLQLAPASDADRQTVSAFLAGKGGGE